MRAVIAEDAVLLREGLARLLAEGGFEVAEVVSDGEALLRAVERHRPDVCVVDVRMPPTFSDEGVKASLVIRKQWPDVAILLLSQYVEERYAVDLLAGDSRGIGYLLKDRVADVGDFLEALRRVAAGGAALDPEVVSQLLVRSGRRGPVRRAVAARARGALADGRGAHEQLDRRPHVRHRGRRGEARDQHLRQARHAAGRPGAPARARRAALPRARERRDDREPRVPHARPRGRRVLRRRCSRSRSRSTSAAGRSAPSSAASTGSCPGRSTRCASTPARATCAWSRAPART